MPEKLNAPTLHKRLHTRASTVRNGFFASEPANASSYLAGSRGLPLRNGSLTSWKKKKKKIPNSRDFFRLLNFWHWHACPVTRTPVNRSSLGRVRSKLPWNARSTSRAPASCFRRLAKSQFSVSVLLVFLSHVVSSRAQRIQRFLPPPVPILWRTHSHTRTRTDEKPKLKSAKWKLRCDRYRIFFFLLFFGLTLVTLVLGDLLRDVLYLQQQLDTLDGGHHRLRHGGGNTTGQKVLGKRHGIREIRHFVYWVGVCVCERVFAKRKKERLDSCIGRAPDDEWARHSSSRLTDPPLRIDAQITCPASAHIGPSRDGHLLAASVRALPPVVVAFEALTFYRSLLLPVHSQWQYFPILSPARSLFDITIVRMRFSSRCVRLIIHWFVLRSNSLDFPASRA